MKDLRADPLDRSPSTGTPWPDRPRPRAFVLLAGAVSASSLPAEVGRSVLDLPLDGAMRVLDVWERRIREFAGGLEGGISPEVLLLVGEASPAPVLRPEAEGLRLRVERDSSDYRGTAGALRDLCAEFQDEDHVLVGNASQCPDPGLIEQLVAESNTGVGITLSVGTDGAPTGLMLVRCEALREIPGIGYVDLKEQALPRIARQTGARVVVSPAGGSPPIRSLRTYLAAVRSWHRQATLRGLGSVGPFEERWEPAFALVEGGGRVAPSARLYDSVVLAGGVVEEDCEVVRSVVGRGGVVSRARHVVDELVMGGGVVSRGGSSHSAGATP